MCFFFLFLFVILDCKHVIVFDAKFKQLHRGKFIKLNFLLFLRLLNEVFDILRQSISQDSVQFGLAFVFLETENVINEFQRLFHLLLTQ